MAGPLDTKKTDKPDASTAIRNSWNGIIEDLEKDTYSGQFNVYQGTAVNLQDLSEDVYDLALYSPPYLNNFDYSEIYKLEL